MPVYELRWDASVVDEERFALHAQETAKGLQRLL